MYGVVDRLLEKLPDLRRTGWTTEIRAHVHIFINGDEISTLAMFGPPFSPRMS